MRIELWDDRGESPQLEYITPDGEKALTPKRWTRKWLASLDDVEFNTIYHLLSQNSGYWSPFNLRTLVARRELVFAEMDRRYEEEQ